MTAILSPAPYQLPSDLTNQPLGVSWQTIGQAGNTKPSSDQNLAALNDICALASNQVDVELNQPARARVSTELIQGPSTRMGVLASGVVRLKTSFNPILKVVGMAVAPSAQTTPKTWTVVPIPGGAYPEEAYRDSNARQSFGGGPGVLVMPAYLGWSYGRYGAEAMCSITHGWPHTQLLAGTSLGNETLNVDDVTSMAGEAVTLLDGAETETNYVTSVAPNTPNAYNAAYTYQAGALVLWTDDNVYGCLISNGPGAPNGIQNPSSGATSPYWAMNPEPTGPGVLTLATPLQFVHEAPMLVTGLPRSIQWATALYAKATALQRGLATVTVPGGGGGGMSVEQAIEASIKEAVANLSAYRRIT